MSTASTTGGVAPKFALSIDEFCKTHGPICRASFYNMLRNGTVPKTMRVGSRVLISIEAAAEWRREMEARAVENHDPRSTAA